MHFVMCGEELIELCLYVQILSVVTVSVILVITPEAMSLVTVATLRQALLPVLQGTCIYIAAGTYSRLILPLSLSL